jgi:selenocysteine-specific elongation factor
LATDNATEAAAGRVILGTAGHIDHGKTALIVALTGIDTDRLKEEKTRGISIDLGFAHLDIGGGATLGIVDVPGHERFIKNMLAGVGGIDLVLFVVASDEGIMPQTREHFDIITILGVRHAVFALTKADLVEAEMISLVREEVEDLIEGTPFEGSPIIATSVKSGEGVEALRKALADVAGGIRGRKVGSAVRLPIDRVFTMAGRGTVVTGTLWSGRIRVDQRLRILPGDKPVRVRSVEVHGRSVEEAVAGQRTALGLHGVEKDEIERGNAVVSTGDYQATRGLDAKMHLLRTYPKVLKAGTRVRFHLGSAEVMGRVYPLDAQVIEPGGAGHARIRLEAPLVAGMGDRFVVRTYSPMRTVGGGTVLDPLAPARRKHDDRLLTRLGLLETGDLDKAVEAHVESSELGLRVEDILPRVNCGIAELETAVGRLKQAGRIFEPTSGLYIHSRAVEALEKEVETVLGRFQKEDRLVWGMPKEELRERLGSIEMPLANWLFESMEKQGRLFAKQGLVRLGSGEVELTPEEIRVRTMIISLLKAAPFQPPSEKEIESKSDLAPEKLRRVVALLIQDGQVIRLEPGLIVHADAIAAAAEAVTAFLKQHGEGTASDLKCVLGTTRKYAVPLLEYLDRVGVTKRVGANRRLVG